MTGLPTTIKIDGKTFHLREWADDKVSYNHWLLPEYKLSGTPDHLPYNKCVLHLREKVPGEIGSALFDRQVLIALIENNAYYVG